MQPKFVLLVCLVINFFSAMAQFKKGDRMVGTSIASALYNSGGATVTFPSSPGYKTNTTNYSVLIQPELGWFISETTVVGATLNINPAGQTSRNEQNGVTYQEDKSNQFNIGLGGFARNYFGSSGFMPYGQFGFNLGISSASSEGFKYYTASPNYKVSYDGESSGGFFANAALQVGLTKMLGENAGLDLFAGYTYSYNKNDYSTTTNTDLNIDGSIDASTPSSSTTKFTNHGFIIGAGIQVFLRK